MQPAVKISSRHLTDLDKQRMIDFYISDEYSRQLPDMKNVKVLNNQTEKELKFKNDCCLLTSTGFTPSTKKKFKDTIGVKTFGLSVIADQRPKYVITIGSSGTNSVCVCIYHQNVKLMLSGVGLSDERHLLWTKLFSQCTIKCA